MRRNDFFKYLLLGGGGSASRSELESETLPYTFVSKSQRLKDYRIYGNTVDGESVGDLVTEGEHSGEYMVPVTVTNGTDTQTTNLYLPEQIKMVGDEAEYVDYKEQKQYRVSRNKMPIIGNAETVTSNGATFVNDGKGTITISGATTTNNATYSVNLVKNYTIPISVGYGGTGCIQFNNSHGVGDKVKVHFKYDNVKISEWQQEPMNRVSSAYIAMGGKTINNISFEVQSNYTIPTNMSISIALYENGTTEQIPFEPYIEDTELDVTLPALPTFPGTNTLSVGTTVQPSKVYLQGKISEAEIVSAEPVQTNVQSLQPLSIYDDDFQLDVMPTESDLQLDVMPSDDLRLDVIIPTANLNRIEDDEDAE